MASSAFNRWNIFALTANHSFKISFEEHIEDDRMVKIADRIKIKWGIEFYKWKITQRGLSIETINYKFQNVVRWQNRGGHTLKIY